ncbi:MAG: hypothetical protein AN485_23445, partial [Anabaena sp. MDT14b]
LYHVGVQPVLPPGYLCCGYPQTASGNADKGQEIITDNRVLFHRVANTLNYLDIKTVVVSCGTCMDQLQKYEFEKIFPGCRLLDIHEFLLEKGMKIDTVTGVRYMYHDPCHSPMKTYQPMKVVGQLLGENKVDENMRCCGESGALIDIGAKTAAYIPIQEMSINRVDAPEEVLQSNETREFFILTDENEDGQLTLSIRRIEYMRAWERVRQLQAEDATVRSGVFA